MIGYKVRFHVGKKYKIGYANNQIWYKRISFCVQLIVRQDFFMKNDNVCVCMTGDGPPLITGLVFGSSCPHVQLKTLDKSTENRGFIGCRDLTLLGHCMQVSMRNEAETCSDI